MKRRSSDDHFRTAHLGEGMRRRSVRAGMVTLLSQGARIALSITSTMLLARLLRPDDFGLFAMATTTIALFSVLRDLGLSTATVQRKELSQEIVSTLFWINASFGILLATAAVITAPLLTWFFQDERLTPVAMAVGGIAAIDALTIQHRALLRRQMRFKAIAFAQVTSEAIGLLAGISAALLGAGYWSLVILRLSATSIRILIIWLVCGWRPSFYFDFSSVRSMVAFGGFLTSTRIVRYVSRNFDRFLVGRIWDARALGYYARASDSLPGPVNRLMMPIAGVAISTLSRLTDEPERLRAYFRQGIQIVALLGTPAIGFLFLDAHQIVILLLGDQWSTTIPLFRRLAPAALATLGQMGLHWAFVSLGNAGRQFRWECFSLVIIVIGITLGVRWGVNGVALGYSFTSVLLILPGSRYCFRSTPLQTGDLAGAFVLPILGTLIAAACLHGIHSLTSFAAVSPVRLLFDSGVFSVFYLITLILLPAGRKTVSDVIVLLKDLRKT